MRNFKPTGNGVRRTLMYSALIAALSIGASALADIQQGHQNGIAFENGGWSSETAEVIKGHAGKFSLMLVFAWNEGTYLSDVNLQVVNAKGGRVMSLNDSGPLVLIDLPKGEYTINAERNGKSQSRRVNIGASSHNKAVFHFPKDEFDRRVDADPAFSKNPTTGRK